MLTKHPSNTKVNVERKDEINNVENTKSTFRTEEEAINSERVKTAAKLEGISTEKILSRKTNVSGNNGMLCLFFI